jgi:hypothetical protein
MSRENGSPDDPLAGKWFAPITERIEAFETQSDVFQEFGSITLPESPDWMVQCIWTQMKPYREVSGLERLDRIRARNVGAMIGAKASICKRLAGGNLWFNRLPAKKQNQLANLFGAEAIADAQITWSRFATEILPDFKKLQRFASEVVMRQATWEQMQYHHGVASGLGFMDRVAKGVRQTSKKGADHARRSVVCMFAIEHWEIIEAARRDISWGDLIHEFDKQYEKHVSIDEETFKKILQRSGLTVGRVGRPRLAH